MTPLRTFSKDPNAALYYGFDWSDWFASGETIDTVVWTVPAGLTGGTEANDGEVVKILLSGGTAGEEYEVSARITTTDGQTDERTLLIRCEER